jgi:hypothetical protein
MTRTDVNECEEGWVTLQQHGRGGGAPAAVCCSVSRRRITNKEPTTRYSRSQTTGIMASTLKLSAVISKMLCLSMMKW